MKLALTPKILLLLIYLLGLWRLPLQAAEESFADSLKKYRFLAKAARETRDWDNALGYYGKQLEFEPDPKRRRIAFYQIGKIQAHEKKQHKRAIRALRSALMIDSMHVNTNNLLSQIYLSSGKPDSAAQCLERMVLARPGKTQFRRSLADLCRKQNRTGDAIRHYDALVSSTGESAELLGILAVLHEDAGHLPEALAYRQRLLALRAAPGPDSSRAGQATRETLDQILALQRQTNDTDGAFATLAELIDADPANSYSYNNQVVELAELVGNEQARLRGMEGMALADPTSESVATLVELHLHEERPAEARRWLVHGMDANPASAQLQLLNGDLLIAEGKEEEALEAYARAKLDTNWEQVAQQRIWTLRPPETAEEKLKRAFFGE